MLFMKKKCVKGHNGNQYALWPSFIVILVKLIPPQKVVCAFKPIISHNSTSFWLMTILYGIYDHNQPYNHFDPLKTEQLPRAGRRAFISNWS